MLVFPMFKTLTLLLFISSTYAQTCISHRANGSSHPENSLEALEFVVTDEYEGVEFDIQISKDGIPFLYHDPILKKDLKGQNCPFNSKIKDLNFEEFSNDCFLENDQKLATFEEALISLESYNGYIFIDLKKKPNSTFYDQFENSNHFENSKVRFISFKKRALRPLKRRISHAKTTLLSRYIPRGLFYGGIGFNKRLNLFTGLYRWLGKDVSIWTLNKQEDISKAIRKKADFIITDSYKLCTTLVNKINK
jgi:glycerophosphoryl diester phosphodiesterase